MFVTDRTSIHESEFRQRGHPDALQVSTPYQLPVPIFSRSVLNRDDRGLYTFLHHTFVEYLVADILLSAFRAGNSQIFGAHPLNHDISFFMRELVTPADTAALIHSVLDRTQNRYCRYHAANLLTASFTAAPSVAPPSADVQTALEHCLTTEDDLLVARQIVYVLCFMKGNTAAIGYLESLRTNPYLDELDTTYAIAYFGGGLEAAVRGHIRHLGSDRYRAHRIMDLYHLGKIANADALPFIRPFVEDADVLIRTHAADAIARISSRLDLTHSGNEE